MYRKWLAVVAAGLVASVGGAAPALAVETPAQADQPSFVMALGDSVAAGLGLSPVTNGSSEDATCQRSPQGYPWYVAGQRGLAIADLACSGARVWDGVVTDQQVGDMEVPSQLRRAAQYHTPEAVTLTAGANDVYWSYYVGYCQRSSCGSPTDTRTFDALRAKMRLQLWTALWWVQSLGASHTFVTGYYDPIGGDTSCLAGMGVDATEAAWLRERLASLNAGIADTVRWFPGITYVQPNFGDRGVCSPNSLVQLQGNGALHPTAEGQQVIARQVLAAW